MAANELRGSTFFEMASQMTLGNQIYDFFPI